MTAADPDRLLAADPDRVLAAVCRSMADLVAVARSPLRRVSLRVGDIAVEMEWPREAGRAAPAGGEPPSAAQPEAYHHLCAPMVGTCYLAPEPGAKPFVGEGDLVEAGQQVAILEAMKLMTPVEADRAGRVALILVSDGTRVEYGTPLIALIPADAS
ncbi:acetyl-CoA carboxylase biotin carboxyl carrier protein [Sphaerisporangium perillae]|uniref:acetyl-CoA carboxylase biotin carboxyl carrier protein n=1 Tax=Sphaerisporangium perillae TaxID=2935860 RepID=UPI00200DA373|nr:acetyl-CoA carboxylase biotin carboxyl carrier protein subunit [Sphaerisporangium perillae]